MMQEIMKGTEILRGMFRGTVGSVVQCDKEEEE